MALQAAYQQFLTAPNSALLAEDASMHYITTLVSHNGSSAIIQHLNKQMKQLKKKAENFLDVIEGEQSLAVVVETTIEFVSGGGAYLPGLDDNFLSDHIVTLPIIHIVNFDSNGKIIQVRQNWDQGSLLKNIDVIGKTGRNWPIRDGGDQLKLIASSMKLAAKSTGTTSTTTTQRAAEPIHRSRENSTNVTRDPHATLSLFAPRDHDAEETLPPVIAPRAGGRVVQKDFHELFVVNDDPPSPVGQTSQARERSTSPHKFSAKGGAGRNYQPSRIFDDVNSPIRPAAGRAELSYRTDPKKFQHFDLASGDQDDSQGGQKVPTNSQNEPIKSKHASQWKFEDFTTPQKTIPGKVQRGQDVRHWGTENDEVVDSPIKQKKVDKPRKDAETHFEFKDENTPEGPKRLTGRPRGAGLDPGTGLYQNNLYDEEESGVSKPEPRVLGNIANIKDRRKDFEPHFTMTDDSPVSKENLTNQKENAAPVSRNDLAKGISIGGNGMGGKAGTKSWGFEDDVPVKTGGISIGGNGMGGKAGTGRGWSIGDESDGEETTTNRSSKSIPGRKQGTNSQTGGGGDFWNY